METITPPLLTAEGLTKRYIPGHLPEVDSVSFNVGENEIFAILGPSGCGKTTTLRILAGFETVEKGRITLKGRVLQDENVFVKPEKRGIGFVFQDYALFPHLSVYDNIRFGIRHLPRDERHSRVEQMLELTNMKKLAARKPFELSGGQQQRVALARALAPSPGIILLDEPFSNLDAVLRQSTRQDVRNVLKEARMSAVLVTHDQEEALSIADRIAIMDQAHIVQTGTPEEIYYKPKTAFVAAFLGHTNVMEADAEGTVAFCPIGSVQLNAERYGKCFISLRPENLDLNELNGHPQSGTSATVVQRSFKGHYLTYTVVCGQCKLMVHTTNRKTFHVGDEVRVVQTERASVLEL